MAKFGEDEESTTDLPSDPPAGLSELLKKQVDGSST